MLRAIDVEGFQSLRKHLHLALRRFTVITGATGSGKSSLIRAASLAAFNARGTAYISTGSRQADVTLTGDDAELDGMGDEPWEVHIRRTSQGRGDLYSALFTQMGQQGEEVYTKLAGKVPEDITRLLRLTPLNFAKQFDRPFLLDDTGSEVARVLGELTNVTLILSAAQEANRRRLEARAELRLHQAELARLRDAARQFITLKAEQEAIGHAEKALETALALDAQAARLGELLRAQGQAREALARVSLPPPPPSLDVLEGLERGIARLSLLLTSLEGHQALAASAVNEAIEAGAAELLAGTELTRILAEAGVCPTCGQPTGSEAVRCQVSERGPDGEVLSVQCYSAQRGWG